MPSTTGDNYLDAGMMEECQALIRLATFTTVDPRHKNLQLVQYNEAIEKRLRVSMAFDILNINSDNAEFAIQKSAAAVLPPYVNAQRATVETNVNGK